MLQHVVPSCQGPNKGAHSTLSTQQDPVATAPPPPTHTHGSEHTLGSPGGLPICLAPHLAHQTDHMAVTSQEDPEGILLTLTTSSVKISLPMANNTARGQQAIDSSYTASKRQTFFFKATRQPGNRMGMFG